jgi:DNA polymerase-3 subunit beta
MDFIIEDGQIFFETGETRLVSRLINGKYPEYKHIMPQSYQTRVVVAREAIISLVRVVSVFGNNNNPELTLKIDEKDKNIILEGKSSENGESTSRINCAVVGPGLEVVLNAKYLLDGLNNVKTNQVAILLNNNTSPIGIKEISEKNGEVLGGYAYIVMPIKNS